MSSTRRGFFSTLVGAVAARFALRAEAGPREEALGREMETLVANAASTNAMARGNVTMTTLGPCNEASAADLVEWLENDAQRMAFVEWEKWWYLCRDSVDRAEQQTRGGPHGRDFARLRDALDELRARVGAA